MTPAAFKQVRKRPGSMLAYFLLRRALKGTRQFRGDVGGLVVVIVDKRWFPRFERAAELLFSGQARAFFNAETSMHRVVSKEYGSKTKLDLDVLSYNAQTILLTDNIEALPPKVRIAAEDTVTVEKPTVRLLNAVRKLAGRPCLDDRTAEAVAGEDWDMIEALLCRYSLTEVDFDNLHTAKDSDASEGPRLSELPGFEPAREWVSKLATDLSSWRDKSLAWSALDRAALLAGPPGVGKTMFAKALAAELGVTLVATSAGRWQSVGDGYLGDMLRAMRGSFDEARSKSPALLFIDELDSIGNREHRSSLNAFYETQVVNSFLELTSTASDWPGVILLAATNRPGDIEPAILRSGRFEQHIEFELPTPEERAAILSYHLGSISPETLAPLTEHLDGHTPADLERLARAAKRVARGNGRSVEFADVEASMPALTKLDEASLLRIATHECGHALVALKSGFVDGVTVKLKDITVLGSPQSAGSVICDFTEHVLPTEQLLRAKIRIALAGMAAEGVVQQDRSVGGAGIVGSDLDEATRIATRMVASYGMGDSPLFEIDYRRVNESYRPPAYLRSAIDRILREEWDGAKHILNEHTDRLRHMAGKLVSQRKMRVLAT
ncbi:AAA family ATPase [Pararhizobium sp. YC-54]|uniref:AAA family ATPase n=1 Tax=Pararhizobium sp. YC-54 TaxID=2986920 RepID=UPI0021F6D4A5|nr:AAA family ATPase [Pararhizobium sp. YC-54]MCW0001332.1 AAA family ATPase [Pararhizobium sp. YC-54]